MAMPLSRSERYSYADYCSWPQDQRWELLEGIPYAMNAPSRKHQALAREFLIRIGQYLAGKTCRVYGAPFDVRLVDSTADTIASDERIMTVIQPDITVICDPAKLDRQGCLGAPDWLIEIVSPGSAQMDYIKKLALYEKYGVKEYWIVHPLDETLMVFRLDAPDETAGPLRYGRPAVYGSEDEGFPGQFPDLNIPLRELFAAE